VTITIKRSGDISRSSSVRYSSINGTAVYPNDFSGPNGTISFAIGETSKSFTVAIINDSQIEKNETFSLILSSPTNAILGSPASTVITIIDNDKATARGKTPRGSISIKSALF
jgi:hypothetical protein